MAKYEISEPKDAHLISAKTSQNPHGKIQIPDDVKALSDSIIIDFEQVENDLEVLRSGEELRKKVSTLSPEKLLKQFDI